MSPSNPGRNEPAPDDDRSTLTDAPRQEGSCEPDGEELVRISRAGRALYRVKAPIGRGGMGVVHLAHDHGLGRDVALKEMHAGGEHLRARFKREVLVTAALQHPGIVPVYEVGSWETGQPYYAMKLISGGSLRDHIAKCRSYRERVGLVPNVIAVAEAIAYAHSEGVIHRDLKASNIVIGAFGETVVVDWGLAKVARGPLSDRVDDRMTLTAHGEVIGTPEYMPPEQARGEEVDARADVYAIGAMLYHVLTGAPPYCGDDATGVLAQLLSGPPVPVREREPKVSRGLARIVERAMARSPEERFADADELAAALHELQAAQLGRARFADRMPWPAAFAVAVLVLLAAALWREQPAPRGAGSGTDVVAWDAVANRRDDVHLAEPREGKGDEPVRVDHGRRPSETPAFEPRDGAPHGRRRAGVVPRDGTEGAVAARIERAARAADSPAGDAGPRLASVVVETVPAGGKLFMSNGVYGGPDRTQIARPHGTVLEVTCRSEDRREGTVKLVFDGDARKSRCLMVSLADRLKDPFPGGR